MSTRVITQLGATDAHRALILATHPDVELVDLGYMGWDQILRWLDASGVRWVQLSGTGVDKVPDAVYDGRIVTCARGAAAILAGPARTPPTSDRRQGRESAPATRGSAEAAADRRR